MILAPPQAVCYAMAALEIVTGTQPLLFVLRILRPE